MDILVLTMLRFRARCPPMLETKFEFTYLRVFVASFVINEPATELSSGKTLNTLKIFNANKLFLVREEGALPILI